MAHAGEELALGACRRLGALLRDPQLVDENRQPLGVLPLRVVRGLELVRVVGQLGFDALALGDVADVSGEHLAAVRGDRRDRDLDGKRLAVLPHRRQLETPIQDGGVSGGEIAGHRLAHRLAPVRGKDRLDEIGPDRFRRGVAECPLRCRIELCDTPGFVDQDDAIQSDVENGVVAGLRISRVVLRLLACANLALERRRPVGGVPHLRDAATAGDEKKHVLEQHPGGVLEPPPLAGDHHAVDRLRPEDPAQQVIERHDDCRRNQHPPVAIERQEGQRAEDVKVGLDPPTGQMNEQGAHQHLRDRDDVAGRRQAWPEQSEERRKQADDSAEDDRCPDVQVGPADWSVPRQRRHPQREDDPHEPLEGHQPGKEPVRTMVNQVPGLGEELAGSVRCGRVARVERGV